MPDYASLPDAVLGRLRSSDVATTAGDTWSAAAQSGQIGLGFDYLPPGAALPCVICLEPGESRAYFTAQGDGSRPFLADGAIAVQCWAATRAGALSLAADVIAALHDGDLAWGVGARTTVFRAVSTQAAPPTPDTGLDSPAVFLRVVTFEFQYQGQI